MVKSLSGSCLSGNYVRIAACIVVGLILHFGWCINNSSTILKGIFNVCFICIFTQLPIGALCEPQEKLHGLWLNLCFKFIVWLRNLTDNCVCGVQRCHFKYYCTQLLSIFLLLEASCICDCVSPCCFRSSWGSGTCGLKERALRRDGH